MIINDSVLFDLINGESTITDLLDSFGAGKAIFNDIILPRTFTGKKSVNIYLVSPIAGALEYQQETYSVNCRAEKFKDARSIANAVTTFLNRYNQNDVFIVANIQATIQPENNLDTYNIVVEANIKSR